MGGFPPCSDSRHHASPSHGCSIVTCFQSAEGQKRKWRECTYFLSVLAWKWHPSLPFNILLRRASYMATFNCKGAWEIEVDYVPGEKSRGNVFLASSFARHRHSIRHSHCPQGVCRLMRIKCKPSAYTHHCFCSFDFVSLDLFILNMFQNTLLFV